MKAAAPSASPRVQVVEKTDRAVVVTQEAQTDESGNDSGSDSADEMVSIESIPEDQRRELMQRLGQLPPEERQKVMEAMQSGKISRRMLEQLKSSDSEGPGKTSEEGRPGEKGEDGEDSEKIVGRPTEPPAPPDPNELDIQPDASGRVRFNFHNQPWQGVLEWLADISNMSLDWQELPGDYLNLTTQLSYTVEEARDLINQHLFARGFTMLDRGEVLTVVNLEKLDPGIVPRVTPEKLDSLGDYSFVKTSFALDWLLAQQAAEELEPMISPHGKLVPLSATNRLEAMDVAVNLRELRHLLSEEQSPSGQERLVREFELKHARADEVVGQLKGLLGEGQGSSLLAGLPPEMMQQMQQQMQQMMARMQQQQQQNSKGGPRFTDEPKANFVVNQRKNSILVNAPPDKMAIIEQAVKALDVPTHGPGSVLSQMSRWQVYRLAAIDPQPLVETLRELGGLEPTTRLEIDRENNAIIAYASLADHVTIKALIDRLDGSGRRFEVITLRRLPADYVAGTINFMMTGEEAQNESRNRWNPWDRSRRSNDAGNNKFRVDADVENNRLLLWANDIEIDEVRNLLVKLGELPDEQSGGDRMRVIEVVSPEEADRILEELQRQWPQVAPNPLDVEKAPVPESEPRPGRNQSPNTTPEPESEQSPSGGETSPVQATADQTAQPMHLVSGQTAGASPPELVALLESANAQPLESLAPEVSPAVDAPDQPDQGDSANDANQAEELPASGASEEVLGNKNEGQPSPEDFTPYGGMPREPAPVRVYRGPDGRIVISSRDPQAVARVEDLISGLRSRQPDYRIFRLRYAWAYGVAQILEDVFSEQTEETSRSRISPWYYDPWSQRDSGQQPTRLSSRRPVEFISDSDSNTILVKHATAEQLREIEELIEFYDQPPPTDSQSIRQTRIFQIKYSEAETIAEAIKDVYRDLLSSNDKAFAQQSRDRPSMSYSIFLSDDSSEDQRAPKFKGLLSVGVDDHSNSLIVSAPAFLMTDVEEMIESLDKAAEPTYTTVEVIPLGKSVSADNVRETLSRVFGEEAGRSSDRGRERRPGEGNGPPGDNGRRRPRPGN